MSAAEFLTREASELARKLARPFPPLSELLKHTTAPEEPELRRRIRFDITTRQRHLLTRVRRWQQEMVRPSDDSSQQRWLGELDVLRQQFDALLTLRDIYSDALQQRALPSLRAALVGMDRLARDAFPREGGRFLTYVDGGARASIRSLGLDASNTTRLIRIPRERLTSPFLAVSLLHEVGHAVVGRFQPLQELDAALTGLGLLRGSHFKRWLNEIVPDLWALAHLGPLSTRGLMHVVSFPHANVYRPNLRDPHPSPWIRVQLSAALGAQIYPCGPWRSLQQQWVSAFPIHQAPTAHRDFLHELQQDIPRAAQAIATTRIRTLGNRTIPGAVHARRRGMVVAQQLTRRGSLYRLSTLPPTLATALLGQHRLNHSRQHHIMRQLLLHWSNAAALR